MKIKWYGHAAFGVTTAAGVRVCTDPYVTGSYDGALAYKPIADRFDVVLQSHDHPDHGGAAALAGNPVVLKDAGVHKVKGIEFVGTASWHDANGGRDRGANVVFTFAADGVTVAFLGDLGHVLTDEQAKAIGPADVVMVPVGGFFTIDAAAAWKVTAQLQAKVILPMHYKTPACGFPIAPVDDFLKGQANVQRVGAAEVEITAADLRAAKVMVLAYVK